MTVAAVVARRSASEVQFLLVEEHTPEGLMLNNPAGHLEPGESPLQGVVREVLEETARAFTADRLVGLYLARFQRPATAEDVTYLRIAFGGVVGPRDPVLALDRGIVRTLWMTHAELQANRARHRSPLVLESVQDYLRGRRLPLDSIATDPSVYAPDIKR